MEASKLETEAPSEVPDKWIKLYGDNDQAREAWQLQQEIWKEKEIEISENAYKRMIKLI